MSFIKKIGLVCFIVFCCAGCRSAGEKPVESAAAPRIINIINFIRQTDYRVENADSLLYETVCEQVKLVNKYDLPATFLLQYDALINPLYQDLLKSKLNAHSEIGAWWELTQPQIEAAGIKWRGEHSWVSHANIAFSTGYTKEERERLVDVYMAKFKEIFGTYPKSIGSWFIDAHTLGYMYDKYKIVASCNCKDQVGTDGYTLWGGYWNQAYYPSRVNAYMPAQTEEGQIPVPIFRMLGSDPIYQYDDGLGQERQGVISLEPVYEKAGMDRRWVDYFLESIVDQPCLAFNYAQAGQENSFTWSNMSKGLEMQIPILDSLRKENKIRVETLGESGAWFKECFKVTPPTAVTTLTDVRGEGNKTVWNPKPDAYDFYDMKGIVEEIFSKLGFKNYQIKRSGQSEFHPGRSVDVFVGREYIGSFGEIHPDVLENFDLGKKSILVAEFNMDLIKKYIGKQVAYKGIVKYPSVPRDLALVMDENILVGDVLKTIEKTDNKIEKVELFDIYRGQGVEEGKKSVAISIILRDKNKTLEEKEINDIITKILEKVKKDYNAELRQ